MASGAAVPHPLRHGVGLVPDDILPQIPAIRSQGHGQCPGNAQQVLVFEASTVFPAVTVAYDKPQGPVLPQYPPHLPKHLDEPFQILLGRWFQPDLPFYPVVPQSKIGRRSNTGMDTLRIQRSELFHSIAADQSFKYGQSPPVKGGGRRRALPPLYSSSASDEGEDLTGKGDHDTAGDGEHTVGALGGVVALEGQAQLEDAEAKQDQADGPDQGENELAQVLHDLQGIVRGESGDDHDGHRHHQAGKDGVGPLGAALNLLLALQGVQGLLGGLGLLDDLHRLQSPFLHQMFRFPGRTAVPPGTSAQVFPDGGCRAAHRRQRCNGWRGDRSARTSDPSPAWRPG